MIPVDDKMLPFEGEKIRSWPVGLRGARRVGV